MPQAAVLLDLSSPILPPEQNHRVEGGARAPHRYDVDSHQRGEPHPLMPYLGMISIPGVPVRRVGRAGRAEAELPNGKEIPLPGPQSTLERAVVGMVPERTDA